jgi:hypothetical protein
MNRKLTLLSVVVVLLLTNLACSLVGAVEETIAEEVAPEVESDEPVEDEEEAAPAEQETEAEEMEEAESVEEEQPEEDAALAEEGSTEYDTEFPLPETVESFTAVGDTGINFATDLSIEEAVAFYRQEFEDAGLTERSINTAITDTTFSIVFDGHESGQAIIVQGVDLGNGSTNINIRFEDV